MDAPFHILAVEDDESDALLIERVALQSGLVGSIRVLQTAEESQVYLLGEEPYADREIFPAPDVVLLDLKLRRMSGLDLLRWIRLTPALRGTSVVVLSGTASESNLNRAYELGIEGYLVKPMGFRGLANTLAGVLVTLPRRRAPLVKPAGDPTEGDGRFVRPA